MNPDQFPKSRDDLEALLGKIGESQQLEYKAAQAIEGSNRAKAEITKDVSAMANAAGGTIIYGIKEYEDNERAHLPETITPIDSTKYSREWLDQIVGTIQPKIDGLKIIDVHVGPGSSNFCYVVVVPQGKTAHQATDHKYYKRRNFEVTSMPDYEVRDVMNRRTKPSVSIQMRIFLDYGRSHKVRFKFINNSAIMVQHVGAAVSFPVHFANHNIQIDDANLERKDDCNHWQFFVGGNLVRIPLFPRSEQIFDQEFKIVQAFSPDLKSIVETHIAIFADDMEPVVVKKNAKLALQEWV